MQCVCVPASATGRCRSRSASPRQSRNRLRSSPPSLRPLPLLERRTHRPPPPRQRRSSCLRCRFLPWMWRPKKRRGNAWRTRARGGRGQMHYAQLKGHGSRALQCRDGTFIQVLYRPTLRFRRQTGTPWDDWAIRGGQAQLMCSGIYQYRDRKSKYRRGLLPTPARYKVAALTRHGKHACLTFWCSLHTNLECFWSTTALHCDVCVTNKPQL